LAGGGGGVGGGVVGGVVGGGGVVVEEEEEEEEEGDDEVGAASGAAGAGGRGRGEVDTEEVEALELLQGLLRRQAAAYRLQEQACLDILSPPAAAPPSSAHGKKRKLSVEENGEPGREGVEEGGKATEGVGEESCGEDKRSAASGRRMYAAVVALAEQVRERALHRLRKSPASPAKEPCIARKRTLHRPQNKPSPS
jgi:hypothetical protein